MLRPRSWERIKKQKPGNHHSQQTDTGTENQTPHVLTHKQVLNNENTWTQGGEHHTLGSVGDGEIGEGQQGVGSWGGITWGEMPDIGDVRKAANHTAMCVHMQQSYMFFTCTPKPNMQLKKVTHTHTHTHTHTKHFGRLRWVDHLRSGV